MHSIEPLVQFYRMHAGNERDRRKMHAIQKYMHEMMRPMKHVMKRVMKRVHSSSHLRVRARQTSTESERPSGEQLVTSEDNRFFSRAM